MPGRERIYYKVNPKQVKLIRRAVDNIVKSSMIAEIEQRKRRTLEIVGRF